MSDKPGDAFDLVSIFREELSPSAAKKDEALDQLVVEFADVAETAGFKVSDGAEGAKGIAVTGGSWTTCRRRVPGSSRRRSPPLRARD